MLLSKFALALDKKEAKLPEEKFNYWQNSKHLKKFIDEKKDIKENQELADYRLGGVLESFVPSLRNKSGLPECLGEINTNCIVENKVFSSQRCSKNDHVDCKDPFDRNAGFKYETTLFK